MIDNRGFLILEILIAGLIITSSIAAAMYLFKMGFEHLERANTSNVLSVRLPEALNLLRAADLSKGKGSEDLGDDISISWEANLIEKVRPVIKTFEDTTPSNHELYLYKVDFALQYQGTKRQYEVRLLKSKTFVLPKDAIF